MRSCEYAYYCDGANNGGHDGHDHAYDDCGRYFYFCHNNNNNYY